MITRRLTPVAVLLAALLAMGAGVAKAQIVRITVKDTEGVNVTAHVTVTGVAVPLRTFSSVCLNAQGFDINEEGAKVVVLDHTGPPPAATVVPEMYFSEPLAPGTRLVNLRLVASCTEGVEIFNVFECEIANPHRLDVALVTTPAGVTLDADHEAVVGADTDELGIADAVCVKKGQKAIKTEIVSDTPLESGDRLTDFLELDFNPATGETLYGAWLEY